MCVLRTYTYYLPLKMLDPLNTEACHYGTGESMCGGGCG